MAMEESLTGHGSTDENPADIATECVLSVMKRNHLVSKLLYDIMDHD